MTASVALQKAIRSTLIADPNVLGFVGADAVFDRSTKPERFPCVVVGEAQTLFKRIAYGRRVTQEYATLHVWTSGEALIDAKALAGVVAEALADGVGEVPGFHVVGSTVTNIRAMRDPSERLLHAVVSFEALAEEVL